MNDILTILIGLLIGGSIILGKWPVFKQPLNCRLQLFFIFVSIVLFTLIFIL